MNERINELLQQARDFINEVSAADGVYQGKEYPQAVREKFAELLIKECASICDQQGRVGWNDDRKAQARLDRDLIKEHFGIA